MNMFIGHLQTFFQAMATVGGMEGGKVTGMGDREELGKGTVEGLAGGDLVVEELGEVPGEVGGA